MNQYNTYFFQQAGVSGTEAFDIAFVTTESASLGLLLHGS